VAKKPTRPEAEVSEDELERQQGEPLPDREAMSIIQPEPIPLPWPVDDTATDTSPATPKDSPHHTMPVEPNPKQ
jgi:hypothetical protein